MKTIKAWLNRLPDGYRELALANFMPGYGGDYVIPCINIRTALIRAFNWADSKEGYAFWRAVYGYLHRSESILPPIPGIKVEEEERKYTKDEVRQIVWAARRFYHYDRNLHLPFNQLRPLFNEWFNNSIDTITFNIKF